MGMDVYGKKPTSEIGEYFRNTVWWWHPLWEYCCDVGNNVINEQLKQNGHYNDGNGLSATKSKKLATLLQTEVDAGRTKKKEEEHTTTIATMPDEPCEFCNGTGKRTDAVAKKYNMDWCGGCNGCNGTRKVRPAAANYPFSEENVIEFIAFLNDCGGFSIN